MLAGKLVIEHLSKTTDPFFHFPNLHEALMNPLCLPIFENGQLNPKIFDSKASKLTVLTDAVSSQKVVPIDLSILLLILKEKQINLVIDESNSIGISLNKWQDAEQRKYQYDSHCIISQSFRSFIRRN